MSVLFALAFVAFPYIALEVSLPVGSHTLNAPVGDLAALGLVLVNYKNQTLYTFDGDAAKDAALVKDGKWTPAAAP